MMIGGGPGERRVLPTSGLQLPSGREPIVQKEKLEEPACGMVGTQTLAAG